MKELMGIIVAILIGFVFISGGISILATNFVIGIGFIVAGLAAILFGFKALTR